MNYKEEAFTEKIHLFLSGEMAGDEQIEFENLMNKDDSLRDEVEFQKGLTQYMQDRGAKELEHRIAVIRKKQENQRPFQWKMLVAAVLVLGIISVPIYFFMSKSSSDPVLLSKKYFEPYPDYITQMGGTADSLEMAMEYYNKEKYGDAYAILKEIRNDSSGQSALYLSICQLQNNESLEAITTLKRGRDALNDDDELKPVFHWYLIMSYLKSDNAKQAKLELKDFLRKDYRFNLDKAQNLSKELNLKD